MIIVVLSIITGSVFKKHRDGGHLISCLAMCVAMTKSTLVGMIMATWIPDMVLAAILSIILSLALVIMMIYGLSPRVFVESFGSLFMGAMMGAMLSLMATNYDLLGLAFFAFIYILSCVLSIGLLNMEETPNFIKAIPMKVIVTATMATLLLMTSFITDSQAESKEIKNDQEFKTEHNH